jgi:hypothetical protein
MLVAAVLVLRGWHTEAGREVIVGSSVDIIVSVALTIVLSLLAHRHLVKPALERHRECEREAERRHQEQMEAHRKVHEYLGIGL